MSRLEVNFFKARLMAHLLPFLILLMVSAHLLLLLSDYLVDYVAVVVDH